MFKLESYITPIILSYVNRYINNFRPEDSQVSLWGGEATFHNLELNLEVLEEELQLPFSFVSGSIRELSIYVPWTKITSEPIRITINTIECILNLKGKETKKVPKSKNKDKKIAGQQQKIVEAPPGYIQSLINKIVSNISIHINNLILKYVEEDIVLSMNVKLLKFQSANDKWEPAYSDLSPAQVTLRKVISISDLTLCLDKRNASGKIEIYQEPVLYKCSMTIHLLRHYHSATANRASTTRLDIYCNSMEFSMTEQQVPMLLRILMLLYALQQKQLKPEAQASATDCHSGTSDVKGENPQSNETWTGWAWSYVSSVLPAPWEEEWTDEQLKNSHKGHTLQLGFYVDRASLTFKVSESSSERGYYSHKKLRYIPMLSLELQGIYSDTIIHGLRWFSCTGGISEGLLIPSGFCSCGHLEVNESTAPYLKLGSQSNFHKNDSLFDADAVENKGGKRLYHPSWDLHMSTNTEQVLLEKTPAFAFDYVYQIEIPSDMTSDLSLSDMGSNLEFSNLSESSSLRLCIGPFCLRVCSGLFHRLDTLHVAGSFYDYPPYYVPKPDLPLEDLLPPSAEDFDALSEFIPQRSMRVTFFAPAVDLELMEHPYFEASKACLFKRNKKASVSSMPTTSSVTPKITIECQFIDISQQIPMYVNRLVHTTCQLPEPPDKLFYACYVNQNVKVVGLLSRLMTNSACQSIILTPFSLSYGVRSILKPQYWTKADMPHEELTFESESLTINSTKAKMLVVYSILERLILRQPEPPMKSIYSCSLLTDASRDYVFPQMELCIEGIRFRRVTTNSTRTIDLSLKSVQAFIFEYTSKLDNLRNPKDIQQVLFISGPDPSERSRSQDLQELPLLTTTIQFPLDPTVQKHPPILIFNLQEIRICVDPLLCKWLLYVPKSFFNQSELLSKSFYSEASNSMVETPRKPSTYRIESVHSSSDRETPQIISSKPTSSKENPVDAQEKIYNILKTWFDVWKGLYLCGDISQCTIYFPMMSLSAVGSQGIQEAVEQAVNQENPPDVMVITLPFANIRSAQRQSVSKYLRALPVTLPESIWSVDKSSFPWTVSISELSCYTIQFGNKLTFLKPVSLNATVGLSTRPSKNVSSDIGQTSAVESPNTSKIDIGYLGVCIHIDMTPVVISTSEIQVYLFASILYGLMEVATNMLPKKPQKEQKIPEILPPLVNKASSTMSPTITKEHTIDNISEATPPVSTITPEIVDDDTVKLTAWIQWTITRFTIELLSSECKLDSDIISEDEFESLQPRLKLVLDAEDIVSSLDFQSVYLKVKSKIGSASIQHFKRATPSSKWKPGPYSGIVMRLRDDLMYGKHHEENSFISITITRASCQHTHTLWGAVQKRNKDKTIDVTSGQVVKSRYITEVVVNIQPVDFVISMSTLRSFYLVLIPLLNIPISSENTQTTSGSLSNINNQTLPLAYFEFQGIRVIMPASDLGTLDHDTFIMQIQKISLNPQAVNPICRTPIRSDIYDQAAHASILNIPGSEVEDRQYQLDILGISFSTAAWDDVITILSPSSDILSSLRGLSENPALEWNNLEQGQPNSTPNLNLRYIIDKFDITILAAPAMVYKDTTTICGHAVEINLVSDIFINLSLHQIKLFSALLRDFIVLATPLIVEDGVVKKTHIKFPYSRFNLTHDLKGENEGAVPEGTKDSGIETSDIKSYQSVKGPGSSLLLNKPSAESSDKQYTFLRPPSQVPFIYSSIPLEVVLTSGKVVLSLYQVNESKPVLARYKGKKKKVNKKADEDQGYEASEESFDEKNDNYKKFTPLLYLSFTQPNAFFAKQQLSQRLQLSCFNINLKLGDSDHLPVSHMPLEPDFPVNLLETRSGSPHASSGILPAFFTLKYTKGVGKNSKLEIDFSKPTKLLCKTSKWMYLLVVKDKIIDTFKSGGGLDSVSELLKNAGTTRKPDNDLSQKLSKQNDSYSQFQNIKKLMKGTTSIAVNFDQVIFAIASESDHEIHIGMQKFKSELSISNRPEKLNLQFYFGCLTVTVLFDNYKKLLLNPWSIKFDIGIFWESWQSVDSDPQIQITAESDSIIIDLTSEQLRCIAMVMKDLDEFTSSLPSKDDNKGSKNTDCFELAEKDQYYKDDLRAGAFQFVDSSSDNTIELPLPYQVMFWNKSTSAMAWRYPQPRALTKVRVFPVPYKMALGSQDNLLVLCHLEYWSECRNCYLPYTQFYLSESEICHLNLPEGQPQKIVASTWRVAITTTNEKNDNCGSNLTLSPRALAACMRIDSYFNRSLIPNLNAALYITKIEVNLYNFFPKNIDTKLPECLKRYKSDLSYPENQRFMAFVIENVTSYTSVWSLDIISAEIGCSMQCSVLDYAFLTDHTFIPPFSSKLELSLSKGLKCNFFSKPIQVKFGPSVAHTLAVSTQMWLNKNVTDTCESDFIVVTRYVICNDSNLIVRFGQNDTEENILLLPRQFHLYSWRSQKKCQTLRISIEQLGWKWSEPFKLNEDGIYPLGFESNKDFVLFVSVKSLSKTQKQITLYGQLIVYNLLSEHVEMKIVEAVTGKESKEIRFKNADIHIVPARSPAPSLLINDTKSYFLRLRFYGLDSAWTGDIPLREHLTGAQPWLVKVPLQERGQFLSVWCRIVVQDFLRTKKILAMVWPLFMVRSNLPMSTKVHIETPTLGVHLESEINGKGVLQQLYCPGTIDHSHQLTFHLEEESTNAFNPYVPLNYSLVDQQKFFKKSTKENVDVILEALEHFDKIKWPYFGDDMDDIDWVIDNQPLTHVQVRYQNASQYSCALLVELLPWCLTVNTLGTTIAIMLNNVELCQIVHLGMVAPPRLEESFHIGVCSGNNWFFSGPLQLAKSDWTQSFYMPKISGTIPLEGATKTAIQSESYLCMVLITSCISNEIRLLKLSSTHVISNHLSMQVQVLCLAVADNKVVTELPRDVDKFCFTVPPHLQKSHSGIPIVQWCTLKDLGEISSHEYALYILFCIEPRDGWSCPIRVDKPLIRKSFSIFTKDLSIPVVLTAQEVKGQIFLAIENDPCPQLFIDNRTSVPLRCGQALQDDSGIVSEVEHLTWNCKINAFKSIYYSMPILAEKFPELPQVNFSEKISFAYDREDDTNIEWSAGVSIVNNNSLFIRIPHYGDVKVTIVNSAATTIFIIESVSQVEISAKDIRVRLSLRESEKLPAFEVASKGLERFVKSQVDPSRTTIESQFDSTEPPSLQSLNFNGNQNVVPLLSSMLIPTIPLLVNLKTIEFNVFVNSFTLTLLTDLENDGEERWELASLICDNILIKGVQSESLQVRLTVSDLQFDNQLYTRESYDFPVVLVGQERKEDRKINVLSIPVETLLRNVDSDPLICVDIILETWNNQYCGKHFTGVKQIKLTPQPISCFIEDVFITRLMDYLKTFSPIHVVMWPCHKPNYSTGISASSVNIPELVSWQGTLLAQPLTMRNFVVNPVSILLSVHSSVKMYIALDQSPLHFSKFERRRLLTTHYRLGHALTMHYLSGAIFGAGWVVSSLELLGSPGGLARAMGTGLRDFVSLPYRGLLQGPWAFLRGITTGSASLMRHFTAGTLQSVTKLASSVARNLDRLTLDEEHQKRAEEQRRQRPQGVTQGFLQGMTSLGISLLGAVGGIAHHPLQSVMSDGASPRSLAAGLGLGLVGVLTKPLSGAAELVALTGQGLLQGAGWNSLPNARVPPQIVKITLTNNSMLKYNWKFISLPHSQMLYVTEATSVHGGAIFAAVALILTSDSVVIIDLDEDEIKRVIPLQDIVIVHTNDPTLLSFKLAPIVRENVERNETELDNIEMDPVQRARVVDYVRSTAGLLRFPELNSEHSDISISPLNSPGTSPEPSSNEATVLNFYVSAQKIAYFSCLLTLAKQHSVDDHFPVL